MLIHELATNANKYGACSSREGRIAVTWTCENSRVYLRWQEQGGRQIEAPSREGFGSSLMSSVVQQIKGEIKRDWLATGLVVEVQFPVENPQRGQRLDGVPLLSS
ncbi:MAG: hypothetical protein EON56_01225 [Alphaproteobacteria bacterium]|nr:MAG: hypothetical protein EON56_01225 [Alphaproteobacteria bacterium]